MITSVLNMKILNHIATEPSYGWEFFWSSQKLNVIRHVCWLVHPWDHMAFMNSHESESTYVAEGDKASEITKETEEVANFLRLRYFPPL